MVYVMQVIARETEEADKVKVVVSQEEEAASKEAAGVKAIKVHPCAVNYSPVWTCLPGSPLPA